MNTCQTCKHWLTEPIYNYDMPFTMGRCDNVPHADSAFDWNNVFSHKVLKLEHKNKLAFAKDASGYQAWLVTRAEFGCVSHEPN